MPFYLTEVFGAGRATVGVALSCYVIAALSIRPFSGYLLDTFARKPLYLLAYFVFTAIFAGYLVAGTLTLFMIFRVVHGFAFGAVTVSGNTVVIDIMPSSRRGEGIGYYGLANNIAMSVGPMVGLFMHESCSFETIFLCSLASCALGFAMACLVRTPAKEPVKREPVSLDRFILLKGLPAGLDLLLLSIPYGMTTTYVAMYAAEIGITSKVGIFFTLMAVGMAISRIFSGRQVDKGARDAGDRFGNVSGLRLLLRALLLRCDRGVESRVVQIPVFRRGAVSRRRFRDDVSGVQYAVRQPGAERPARNRYFDLPDVVGRRYRRPDCCWAGISLRSGRSTKPICSAPA